jgi:Protein of unknown function (DUF3800)
LSCSQVSSGFDHLACALFPCGEGFMSFFTVHFDDSGTHKESSIAVASCFVASVEQWKEFNRNWAEVNKNEEFGTFHMADFAFGSQQFKTWDDTKKERILGRLCNIISTRVSAGWSVAVTKRDYDEIIVGPFRDWCGQFHYTFCVRQCAGSAGIWRKRYEPKSSLKYVFDRMSQGKGDIMFAMDSAITSSELESRVTGVRPLGGYSFDSKSDIWPLQAADIFAWTALQHMRKRISNRPINKWAGISFDLLKSTRVPIKWHYYVRENLQRWAAAESRALEGKIRDIQQKRV